MKRCRNCNKEKDEVDFYPHKDKKDGLQSWCKDCFMERNRIVRNTLQQCPRCLRHWKPRKFINGSELCSSCTWFIERSTA